MNQNYKKTIDEKLIDFIRKNPGCNASDIPKGYRFRLRILEKSGKIQFNSGWYVVSPQ